MSINEVMKIGTKGMNTAQKQEEKERRIKVVEKLNEIGEKADNLQKCLSILNLKQGSDARKAYEKKIRQLKKAMDKIKSDESVWMKEAAWFLY